MAWEISQHQFSICQKANRQFCNINAPLQPLANPTSCIKALYTKNAANITTRYSLQIRKAQSLSVPSSIAPNVWILTSAPSTVTTGISLICPGETTKFITVRNPSTSCKYHQLAVLHHNTFIYHHGMYLQH